MAKDNSLIWWVIAGIVLLSGGTAAVYYMKTRGLRNNNPGNIRKTSTAWQGKGTPQVAAGQSPPAPDASFEQFITPEYGIRAMYKILASYQARGLTTIAQMINAWAPPSENNTGAYVDAVSKSVGVDPNQSLSLASVGAPLLAAIIQHENGSQPYSPALIAHAIALA